MNRSIGARFIKIVFSGRSLFSASDQFLLHVVGSNDHVSEILENIRSFLILHGRIARDQRQVVTTVHRESIKKFGFPLADIPGVWIWEPAAQATKAAHERRLRAKNDPDFIDRLYVNVPPSR